MAALSMSQIVQQLDAHAVGEIDNRQKELLKNILTFNKLSNLIQQHKGSTESWKLYLSLCLSLIPSGMLNLKLLFWQGLI